MTITLYSLKNCDTCKKAVKALEGAGKTVSFVDIHAEADLPAKLPGWIEAVGAEALTNTRSTTWRGLDEAQRARAGSDALGLLAENPTLIKRPVIEAGGTVHVGWATPVQEALL